MPIKKSNLAAVVVAAASLLGGGIAVANAAGDSSGSGTSGSGSAASAPAAPGQGQSADTAVTGAEKTKVVDAVEAANDGVTITEVRQDPDGSYDALGTQDGSPVFFDVSEDLKTVTAHTMGDHGGPATAPPSGTAG